MVSFASLFPVALWCFIGWCFIGWCSLVRPVWVCAMGLLTPTPPCRSSGEGYRALERSTVCVSVHRLHVAYIAHYVRSSRVQCVHYVAYEHDTYSG